MLSNVLAALRNLDAYVLRVCSDISHRLQRTTGRTNFFLAKGCGCLFIGVFVLEAMNLWIPIMEPVGSADRLLFILGETAIFMSFVRLYMTRADQESAFHEAGLPTLRSRSDSIAHAPRPLFLLASIAAPLTRLSLLWTPHAGNAAAIIYCRCDVLFLTLTTYFLDVTPLPPGREDARDAAWTTRSQEAVREH